MRIDLNADVGEGLPSDEELIPLVSSVNVACGAHAGDESTIVRTIELARAASVSIGAHPGYPDPEGFGRRELGIAPDALEDSLAEQLRLVSRLVLEHGERLRHVKPHGALYNRAAEDRGVADLVCRVVAATLPDAMLVGLAGSTFLEVGRIRRLRVCGEAFADRVYEPSGRLRPRALPGALLEEPSEAAAQAVSIARDGRIRASDGSWLKVRAETLCVHGDTPGAPAVARAVRSALESAGIAVAPLAS
ncbi:MAG TPA: 5-oxoprolinase subunit PxpA [Candidatus Limnocylindrales bacterium]|nr:5-oxoprolinase subunit PxpA [Candidatus Limnocylindrales bacterium]